MDPNWQRHLLAVTRYSAAAAGCRRAALAAHFGEVPPPCNGMCDLCKAAAGSRNDTAGSGNAAAPQPEEDLTDAAVRAVAALKV